MRGGLASYLPRRLALLGGSTRWSDCAEALRYLSRPAQLVHGAKIKEYEDAFARTVGVKYAIGFASGRIGLYGLLRALGIGEGAEVLLSVPRMVVGNVIAMLAAARAVSLHLGGGAKRWDKTRHIFPAELPQ